MNIFKRATFFSLISILNSCSYTCNVDPNEYLLGEWTGGYLDSNISIDNMEAWSYFENLGLGPNQISDTLDYYHSEINNKYPSTMILQSDGLLFGIYPDGTSISGQWEINVDIRKFYLMNDTLDLEYASPEYISLVNTNKIIFEFDDRIKYGGVSLQYRK